MRIICILLTVFVLGACTSSNNLSSTNQFDGIQAAKTRVSLGLTYLKNANFTQAKFNLDKALEFDPKSGDAHYGMAFYYQQVSEPKLADEYYRKAIALSKRQPDILNSYGVFLCSQARFEEAKVQFNQALSDKSYVANAETYENLALCAKKQGSVSESTNYLEKALNHQPSRHSSLYYLAENYIETENWLEADKALWKYERLTGESASSLYLKFKVAEGSENQALLQQLAQRIVNQYPETNYRQLVEYALSENQPISRSVKIKQTKSTEVSATNEQVAGTEYSPTAKKITNPNMNKGQQNSQFHVVQAGETLYRISIRYNVSIASLMRWNNLANASSIRAGSKLRIKEPNTNE